MLLLAAMAMVVAAGCGESETLTQSEYEAEVREINEASYERLSQLAKGAELPSEEDLKLVADELNTAADELDDLNPPLSVIEAHEAWVNGLRDAADAVDDARDKLTSDDRSEQLKAYQQLGESLASEQLQAAREAFAEAGYDIFATPGAGGGTSGAESDNDDG